MCRQIDDSCDDADESSKRPESENDEVPTVRLCLRILAMVVRAETDRRQEADEEVGENDEGGDHRRSPSLLAELLNQPRPCTSPTKTRKMAARGQASVT